MLSGKNSRYCGILTPISKIIIDNAWRVNRNMEIDSKAEEVWRTYMTTGTLPDYAKPVWYESSYLRPIVRRIPKAPRCKLCYYPFSGVGGKLVQAFLGLQRSKLNPHICNICERLAQEYRGGAELDASFLFADVRGSTRLAENMTPGEFSRLIDRFYSAATHELYRNNAMIEKLIGDEVTGCFTSGFAGADHPQVAVETAQAILKATGHGEPSGPWVPVGVGVHTGNAYIGSVTSAEGIIDIAALGDTVNVAARLASMAKAGEVILSEDVRKAAGIQNDGMEARKLELKGRTEPVDVSVLTG